MQRVLVDALAVKVVVVGEDFHFGSHRQGNVDLLGSSVATDDFDVDPIALRAPRRWRRRADQLDGDPPGARRRRASSWRPACSVARTRSRGVVVMGDQRGRLLGFPTANVEVPNPLCLPADGVYAGWYERPDGNVHPCAINLGRRPTFYEHADHSLLEAHLLDFDGDLYGERAEVRFADFLRSERKFDGIDALIAQLKHDVEHARQLLLGD